ncbi:hypothetical protein LJR175_008391 [Variovorax sp. LjRoot175]|uniref:hypothetical protein n=1 Tax=Variovorax sp. LjRoot175 TaxID=3342276 RepID=UPI003ECDA8F2
MTNPATQAAGTKPPIRFSFGRSAAFAPTPATAPAAAPAAPASSAVASTPVAAEAVLTTASEHPGTTANVAPGQPAADAASQADGAAAAPATEQITIMLPSGGREGQVFGGVFGRMEDGKFRTDPLLKPIYLLQLVDGAEPGAGMDQQRRDLMSAIGGLPETVTISVPTALVAPLKATLAHLSGARWEQLYASVGLAANPMAKFALANEARMARDAVAQITRVGGELFTVQIAAPKELRFMEGGGDDEYDDYGSGLTGVPQPVAGQPVTTAVAGEVALNAAGHETLASACNGRHEGDTVTYTHVESFTVLADSAENAERVLALVPQSLKVRTSIAASDVMVNGQPYILAAPVLDDEGPAADAPR